MVSSDTVLSGNIIPMLNNPLAKNLYALKSVLLVRPPVRSNGRSYKMLVMFFFSFHRVISELPRPITAKLAT